MHPVEQFGAAVSPLWIRISVVYSCGHKLAGMTVVPTTKGLVTGGTQTAIVVQSGSSQSVWPSQSSSTPLKQFSVVGTHLAMSGGGVRSGGGARSSPVAESSAPASSGVAGAMVSGSAAQPFVSVTDALPLPMTTPLARATTSTSMRWPRG